MIYFDHFVIRKLQIWHTTNRLVRCRKKIELGEMSFRGGKKYRQFHIHVPL